MKTSNRNTLLVPTDLSSVAVRAASHSMEIANHFNLKVCLLHIIPRKTTYKEKKNTEDQLRSISEFNSRQSGINISYILKEGNIFDGISDAADEISTEMIVMGVHSNRGKADILGSFAYNVIRSAKVPVMIVNKDNVNISDNHIIVPVDYLKIKSKIKAKIAVKYAKHYNCQVCVTGDVFYDSSLAKKVTRKAKIEKETFVRNIADYIKDFGVNVKTGMVIKPKTILVPTDFTPEAAKALEHSIEIAGKFDRNICLLHVFSEKTTKAEKEKIENLLKTITTAKSGQTGIDISYRIKEGSIFDIITATVSEIGAGFAVMGYHGGKDMKSFKKSFAYSVISNSKVPVMIVKKENKKISDNSIVVPIDLSYEKIKKIYKASKIARYFNCFVHVIVAFDKKVIMPNDDKENIRKRLNVALENEGVRYKSEIIEKPRTILVPVDFSEVAGYAYKHAIEIAKLFKRDIILLHIIGKKTSANQRKKVEKKLVNFSKKYKKPENTDVFCKIQEGSIFNVITDIAVEVSAEIIVMGIHGKKGLQHILGGYAYRIIANSKVPVMIVRNMYSGEGYKNIVVSVDLSNKSKEEIITAIKFAGYFDSTLNLIGVLKSASSANKIKQEVLLANLTGYVENIGVDVNVNVLDTSGTSAHDKVLDYAEGINADLIMIVAKKGGRITEVLGQNYAERIIEKSHIPVLSITPHFESEEKAIDTYSVGYFIDPFGVTK